MRINECLFRPINGFKVSENEDGLYVINDTKYEKTIAIRKLFTNYNSDKLKIGLFADLVKGNIPYLKVVSRKNVVLHVISNDETVYINDAPKFFFLKIVVPAFSSCYIKKYVVETYINDLDELYEFYKTDFLLVSPGYPSQGNKYYWAFIHTRAKLYLENNIDVKVIVPTYVDRITLCEFEGIQYYKINYYDFRDFLQKKSFKNIAVHYLSDEILQILLSISLSNSNAFIYCHSGDLLYRDFNKLGTRYFSEPSGISLEMKNKYEFKDHLVSLLNENPNVTFVFGTEWAKNASESENKIKYKKYKIIPSPIDEEMFSFRHKTSELRKKICVVRKFDNINTYGIDIDVKAIIELSKREFFGELEFNIYGDGNYYDVLVAPLKKFKNVHFHKYFLSHQEMVKVFENNGIALFGTRYETQGVAASEAAMSGLVVISNDVTAVSDTFDKEILSPSEDYIDMANKIEHYYNHPDEFVDMSLRIHKMVKNKSGLQISLYKEMEMFKEEKASRNIIVKSYLETDQPILSVIVPSYNAQQWLKHGVESILASSEIDKIEILIVNDGSKDNTLNIAKQLKAESTINGKSPIKIIDKENGGHGSTINAGLLNATGKYIKVMDSDDYYDTLELNRLVKILENENSDLVLTNYVEDWSNNPHFSIMKYYEFMCPGKQYQIEDLCYEGYGFNRYANILHTSTFKTEMLKQGDFKISEHCFYVDMELNTYAFLLANTVTYYPLNLYMYYLGRSGQSVSPESFKKNYKQHEHVLLKIINEITDRNTSYEKKQCLYRTIVLPMVETQYYIITEYLKSKEEFVKFDEEIKLNPDIYNAPYILKENVKKYREKYIKK